VVSFDAPSIKQNVEEVTLDLMVHDKKQRPILDLKAEDLTVTDEETPVKLTGFHLVRNDSKNGHLVTFLFDRFSGATAKDTENVANKIFKMLPTAGYSYSVMDFSGRLRLVQPITNDHNAITQAITTVTEKSEANRTAAVTQAEKKLISIARTGADVTGQHVDVTLRPLYQAQLIALESTPHVMQDQHTRLNLAGLLAIAQSQQHIAQRKSIIYFTQNMAMDTASKEMVKTIVGAANRAGVSLYIIDMNALNTGDAYQVQVAMASPTTASEASAAGITGPGGTGRGNTGASWGQAQDVAAATDFMRGDEFERQSMKDNITGKSPIAHLAKDTGGDYIDAQESLGTPLHKMLADMTTCYQASYVPPIQDYDGKFRNISVKPVRAGLTVQTKSGYFALAPGADGGIRPFEAPLLNLFNQTLLPTDVKFHAAVLQFGDLPDGNTSTLAIEVPISTLATKEDTHTNLFNAHISVVAQIKDSTGTVIEHFGEDIPKRGALESLDRDKSLSINLQRHFLTVPGHYMMEVAVQDQISGKAGAQRVGFDIAPVVTGGPSLSDIVVVRKIDTFHEGDDPLEPLRYENGQITANLAGEVSKTAKGLSMFMILHPDAKVAEPATLEMEITHNGKAGRRTPLPLPARRTTSGEPIPYMANFSGALAPGDYVVKAMMTQGGKTAVREASFTVEGSPTGGTEVASADVKLNVTPIENRPIGLLTITATTNPLPPPTAEEIKGLIDDTRDHSVHYADSLPNFLCVEVTNRSYDPTGMGNWKHRDTISELLTYRDKMESHKMLSIDGKSSDVDRDAILKRAGSSFSQGELGGILKAVFDPSTKADYIWKETDQLGNGTVQVFNYHVAKDYGMFEVTGTNDMTVKVGYHGMIFIDTATKSVRRVTLIADDLPKDFPTHSTAIAVDYDYIVINAHDYLMPVSAELSISQGKHMNVLNSIEFRDYRRFTSSVKILGFTPITKP
jgi:VWFA-related protein